jgi:acyl carrier protein
MDMHARVQAIVYEAIENLNSELDEDQRIACSPETLLFGGESTIDSLSLVSVIIDVETAVGEAFDRPIALTDDRAMTREVSPFTRVSNLTDYIVELLSEEPQVAI